MKYRNIGWDDLSVNINLSCFLPEGGVAEYHAIIELNNKYNNAEIQYRDIEAALERLQQSDILLGSTLVLKRYFVSDAVNQSQFL